MDKQLFDPLVKNDERPKNMVLTDTMYDVDTPMSLSNGVYNEKYEEWRRNHISEIRSKTAMSPRGEWFWYASVYNGHIYAIGEEQGNYAGGDFVNASGGSNRLKDFIETRMKGADPNSYEGSLYEKIKEMPLVTHEMVKEMERTIAMLQQPDNINKEQYVSYDVAILLMAKGFNWYCKSRYNIKTKEFQITDFDEHNDCYTIKNPYMSAPTQQMAMRWLREKCNKTIEIGTIPEPKGFHWRVEHLEYFAGFGTFIDSNLCRHENVFNTYEEACEAAIMYCLKNLI